MESPSRYTVVFDASVLVPGFLANLLLWLAQTELFEAKWSADIHDEWIRARQKRYNIDTAVSQKRRAVMDEKFPQALVTGYEGLIDSLTLTDRKDRHVVAAAITSGASAIVTTNLKHFPEEELSRYNIAAINQDDFISDQLGLTTGSVRLVATAIVGHKKSLRKSRTTWRQYLEAMARPGVGLQNTYAEVSTVEFKALLADVIRLEDWLPD